MSVLIPHSGTVYTPAELADAMVRALGDDGRATWLDPCVGEGAFVRAIADLGVPKARIMAVDLDHTPSTADIIAKTVRGTDFVSWSQDTGTRFDRIVANPPYVALSQIDPTLLRAALAMRGESGPLFRLKANYWCAFLLSALRLLSPGGSMCMVLPAAWDYADYAASLRSRVPLHFRRFEVYRSSEPLFGSVQDGCVVIVGRDFNGSPTVTERFEVDSRQEIVDTLCRSEKSAHATGTVVHIANRLAETERPTRPFGDAFELRIGAVTGDSAYFLLTESERRQYKLPVEACRRCLTRASHLRAAEVTDKSWHALRESGARIWLFHPPDRLIDHPAVARYMSLSAVEGGCQRERFKVRSREPWYRAGLPKRVEGFLSGMSRLGPWICLRQDPRLTATNTLYTVRFRLAATWEERAAWALSLFAPVVRRQLMVMGRRYPDGLLKYEPGDLQRLLIPVPPRTEGSTRYYRDVVGAFLAHDRSKFDRLVSKWFGDRPKT